MVILHLLSLQTIAEKCGYSSRNINSNAIVKRGRLPKLKLHYLNCGCGSRFKTLIVCANMFVLAILQHEDIKLLERNPQSFPHLLTSCLHGCFLLLSCVSIWALVECSFLDFPFTPVSFFFYFTVSCFSWAYIVSHGFVELYFTVSCFSWAFISWFLLI